MRTCKWHWNLRSIRASKRLDSHIHTCLSLAFTRVRQIHKRFMQRIYIYIYACIFHVHISHEVYIYTHSHEYLSWTYANKTPSRCHAAPTPSLASCYTARLRQDMSQGESCACTRAHAHVLKLHAHVVKRERDRLYIYIYIYNMSEYTCWVKSVYACTQAYASVAQCVYACDCKGHRGHASRWSVCTYVYAPWRITKCVCNGISSRYVHICICTCMHVTRGLGIHVNVYTCTLVYES